MYVSNFIYVYEVVISAWITRDNSLNNHLLGLRIKVRNPFLTHRLIDHEIVLKIDKVFDIR